MPALKSRNRVWHLQKLQLLAKGSNKLRGRPKGAVQEPVLQWPNALFRALFNKRFYRIVEL